MLNYRKEQVVLNLPCPDLFCILAGDCWTNNILFKYAKVSRLWRVSTVLQPTAATELVATLGFISLTSSTSWEFHHVSYSHGSTSSTFTVPYFCPHLIFDIWLKPGWKYRRHLLAGFSTRQSSKSGRRNNVFSASLYNEGNARRALQRSDPILSWWTVFEFEEAELQSRGDCAMGSITRSST